MIQRLRMLSVLMFLFAALLSPHSVQLHAADCTGFFNNCTVIPTGPYSFAFACTPGVTCNEIVDCWQEACGGQGSIGCTESCSPYGGPCGQGSLCD